MKLFNKNKRVNLFEEGILIDRNLPKYVQIQSKDIKKTKEILNVLNEVKDIDVEINKNTSISYLDNTNNDDEYRELTPQELLDLFKDNKTDINAEDFNFKISRKILKILQNNRTQLFSTSSNIDNLDEYLNTLSEDIINKNKSIYYKIWNYIKRFYFKLDKTRRDEKVIFNTINFFSKVKLKCGKEQVYVDRVNILINLLRKSIITGQEAFLEKIIDELVINKYESILYANGYNKYISENELLSFSKESLRDINIDYIKNYIQEIPDDIIEKKFKADQMNVFDNYFVLHYDPKKKNSSLTKREIEAKKDPILFGVIKDSNKLYYIGDWITEDCNLTWEKFEKKFKSNPDLLKITNKIRIKL